MAATRYRLDDTRPYLYKTGDYGRTWTPINSGIPSHEFTRAIREDPNRRGLLYAGTETGLYASADDGANWHRLGGNLPVVPIYDLVVHGVEMVVATHGRSFWILDDLSPLHQLMDGIDAGSIHLFQPRPTMRMRTYRRFCRDLVPSMTNFQGVDTSQAWVDVVRKPDGSLDRRYLNVGANPPDGVTIHYFLEDRPADGVTLTVLDDAGRELRSFTTEAEKLSAEPGMNRFVWNMRLPGAPNVDGADLEPWHRPDGPLVLPGMYQVRLAVGDRNMTQSFEIQPDPRIQTGPEDLRAQHDLLKEILARLTLANETINRVDKLLAQSELWEKRATDLDDAEAVRSAAADLAVELHEIRGKLIDVNMKQAQLWPSGLHEKLNALFDCVDSADYVPTQQSREVFAELAAHAGDLAARVHRAVDEKGGQLEAAIQAAGLPPIG